MNGMLILLIAHYEGKLLCRNFIFLLLCGFMLLHNFKRCRYEVRKLL